MNPIVANIKHGIVKEANLHLFCGRETSFKPQHQQMGLKFAGMGNPHPVGRACPICNVTHNGNGDAASAYEPDPEKIDRIVQRIREGKTVALYCFCKPNPCHTDIIEQAVIQKLKST